VRGRVQEKEIIALLRARREAGLSALATQYGALIRYVAGPILRSESDREECVQDVLLRIWERIDGYAEDRGSWTAWITVIARNAAIDMARRRGRELPVEALSEELSAEGEDPEAQLLREERRERLAAALSALSGRDRALFYRKYYYLQSTAQIAAETGSTERAVEGRLYRIRRRLRDLMGGEEA